MIQTLNISYSSSSSSKTDEIMSRYRPIAPKPEIIPSSTNNSSTNNNNNVTNNDTFDNGPLVPEKFRQSPYLRNMWSHLQARPTRTRKRGRSSGISATAAASLLRNQQHQQQHQQHQQHKQQQYQPAGLMGLCSARNMSMQAFGVYQQQQQQQQHEIINSVDDKNKKNGGNDVVELQLLCCPMLSSKSIDLNSVAVDVVVPSLSEEMDLQLQLQVTSNTNNNSNKEGGARGVIISPRPVRPVGSTISIVGPINEDLEARALVAAPEQVEAEVEAESLPAVISDRSNKVRMANSAYKELVGQPECPWLDEMCTGGRISGEVVLLLKSNDGLTRLSSSSSNGFSCWVKIEWESDKKEKKSVNAFCDVVKLVCLSKDYVYSWRFHTKEGSTSCASKV